MTRKLERPKAAAGRVGYHPVHMLRKARDPEDDFPAPIQIGPNAIAFDAAEIDAWIERRIAERDGDKAA
jgi:predicted DNA-binding transcriptional regulator AlpA